MKAISRADLNQTTGEEPERRDGDRSETARSEGSFPVERGTAPPVPDAPDPEVAARRLRRRFTSQYKLEVLRKADACTQAGQLGALLRKEGLYSSHLASSVPRRASSQTCSHSVVRLGSSRSANCMTSGARRTSGASGIAACRLWNT